MRMTVNMHDVSRDFIAFCTLLWIRIYAKFHKCKEISYSGQIYV